LDRTNSESWDQVETFLTQLPAHVILCADTPLRAFEQRLNITVWNEAAMGTLVDAIVARLFAGESFMNSMDELVWSEELHEFDIGTGVPRHIFAWAVRSLGEDLWTYLQSIGAYAWNGCLYYKFDRFLGRDSIMLKRVARTDLAF
jgi:hypothetical protein